MLRFGGRIPVTIYPVFWIIALLIGWMNSMSVVGTLVWTVVILISILFHEFGHALTAIAFGQNPRIDLLGFGGLTIREGPRLRLWKEFIIVLNGPLAGFFLCFLTYMTRMWIGMKAGAIVGFGLQIGIYVNLVWTLINLLPILPLDGGRLMSIFLEGIFGLRGLKFSFILSIILAGALSAYLFVAQVFLGGALFLLLAFESFRSWQAASAMTPQDHNTDLQNLLKEAENNLQEGRKSDAQEKFQEIRQHAKSGFLYISATERLAELAYENGKYRETYDLLYPLRNKLSIHALRMLHQAAYRLGEWKEAIVVGNTAFQTFPSYDTALINALCYALIGEDKPAIGWLQCSIREGLPNLNEILQKREFDHIRSRPSFQNFLKTL